MTFTIPESGIIPVEYFKDLLDISKISYYNLEEKDGVLTLRFYDSKKKLIQPYRVCSKDYKESKNGTEDKKGKKVKSKTNQVSKIKG